MDNPGNATQSADNTDLSQAQNLADSSSNQTEDAYARIHDALAAKPAILHAILENTQRQANRDFAASLSTGNPYSPGDAQRLSQAEKQYQKVLDKNAEQLLTQFKNLPIDRKIDLLIEAEQIAEINDKARAQARENMAAARAEAIAARQAETKSLTIPEKAATLNPWAPSHPQDAGAETLQRILQPPLTPMPNAFPLQAIAPSTPEKEKHLTDHLGIGSPAALTVNLPFTAIPGLPALNTVLQKIDRVAHLDLGFTIKGVADRQPNDHGGYDELYRLSYVGGGIMSSKFNVQFAPLALNLEEKTDAAGWGGSSSVFAKRRSDLIGEKFSLNVENDDVGLSFAPEVSYQIPSNRIISNFTGGRYFGSDGPSVRIPGEYVGTLNRIIDALPTKEDMGVISDRISKVIPVEQALEIGLDTVEGMAEKIAAEVPAMTAARFLLAHGVRSSGLSQQQQDAIMGYINANTGNSDVEKIHAAVKLQEHRVQAPPEHQLPDQER